MKDNKPVIPAMVAKRSKSSLYNLSLVYIKYRQMKLATKDLHFNVYFSLDNSQLTDIMLTLGLYTNIIKIVDAWK